MGITPEQIAASKVVQDAAAHEVAQTVRLVAGPGTGKSFAIEERVSWLLGEQGIPPSAIIAVSFTRAASKDLKERINSHCVTQGHEGLHDLRVSTLHSLALWILRRTGNLEQYPTAPMILDDWESKNVFDAEYGNLYGLTPTRCAEIRADHEAFWNTGIWNPPNLPVPAAVISEAERQRFNGFYVARTQTYSCVLPGEVVRRCVELVQQGLIDAVDVLRVQHLIIDEVQDLNPCDFEFIEALIAQGVVVFIAGDDDQSVYSFRHAYPEGIQRFTQRYPETGDHVLSDCFRCTPQVLSTAISLINNFSTADRIPKNLSSLYTNSDPPNPGHVVTKTLNTGVKEAEYVANTCNALISLGISPKDIMVLVGNKRATLKTITNAFENAEGGAILYDADIKDDFIESDCGRFLLACLRITLDSDDYVAHRVLLGTRTGVGIGTCRTVADKVLNNNLNFRSLFYDPLPNGVFSAREMNSVNAVRDNLAILADWNEDDTVDTRAAEIQNLLQTNCSDAGFAAWQEFSADLPSAMNLRELRDYFYGSSPDYRSALVNRVNQRLGIAAEENVQESLRVRIMSFHSSKGLSAKVVFIPGLEELVFPTQGMQQNAGRIFEAARLLYVAITRAKAACVLTRSLRRTVNGKSRQMAASRFCAALNRPFSREPSAVMSDADIQLINEALDLL